MMGFFSMFTGLMYNEWFSIPLSFFHSCYTQEFFTYNSSDPYSAVGFHKIADDCVYEVGVDPVWVLSTNYLNFANSFKMKLAVILGVLQMNLGIVMKGFNAMYFGQIKDILFEFIP